VLRAPLIIGKEAFLKQFNKVGLVRSKYAHKIDPMNKSGHRVRIKLEYKVQYADPLQVVAGETVTVGREDDEFPGWKWCKASDGREGWMPVEMLSHEKGKAVVLHDYSARELAVQRGEEVVVQDTRHGWLLVRNRKGKRGWIPASHTEPLW